MKVPYSWLLEFAHVEDIDPQSIAEQLTLKGAETSLYRFETHLEGVVIGKVVEAKPINERLNLYTIDTGGGYFPKVVSGDKTLRVGDKVVYAPPSSKVGDRIIEKKEFNGIISEGMLLSPEELLLESGSDGVLRIEEEAPLGKSPYELLGFGEYVLELDITPNRGDLLSVRGVAREVCAIFGRELKKAENIKEFEDLGDLDIEILDAGCKRYRGVLIEGVIVRTSPLWIRRRLWQCGVRSINNVVDVTNYVMLEYGQPLHAFDADKLSGGIRVRSAKEGEKLLTLAGTEEELKEEDLVIADEEKPLAIAGVIGGKESGVSAQTKRILLESAYFEPYRIRRTSKAHSLQTDSSYRFERGADIEGVKRYQDRAVGLILSLAGGEVRAVKDKYPEPYKPRTIFLSLEKYRRYAGEPLNREEVSKILTSLEIPHKVMRCGVEVYVPSFRSFDIQGDTDIIEEVLRVKGYDNLPSEVLNLPSTPSYAPSYTDEVRKFLRDRGLFEVINFSFEDKELYELLGLPEPTITIANPLVKTQSYMRTSLIPSLLRTCMYNQRQYNFNMGIHEIGRVYKEDSEEERLGVLLVGTQRLYPYEDYTIYHVLSLLLDLGRLLGLDLKSEKINLSFLHPYLQVGLKVGERLLGFVGELHPKVSEKLELRGKVYVGEMSLSGVEKVRKTYKPFSKFPPVIRDISLVIDKEAQVDKLISHIRELLRDLLEDVKVFSVYVGSDLGEGKKSVSFRLVFRSFEKTLSDGEVNSLVERLITSLEEKFGARLR